ncbi:MAG: DegT/DnrJ/EryC1/StrS family aminotransferase, partial [Pseudomonadota bacterium]
MNAWPHYEEDEVSAVTDVLRSGRPNYHFGDEGKQFEKEFAQFHDVDHAIAVANGTVALELAMQSLEVGDGDEVIVTPRTFIASVSSVVLRGATPVFADVDSDTQNISEASIKAVITKKTKAIMPVHLAGWPCDMPRIRKLADEHGLLVIEDCAQAHGARVDGALVGTYGDAAAFSFCTDKIMSTGGEGGMVLFQNANAWDRAFSFKDHGKSFEAVYHREHPEGFRWLHESFGTNWRMTEISAAIGRAQLKKLESWVAARNDVC